MNAKLQQLVDALPWNWKDLAQHLDMLSLRCEKKPPGWVDPNDPIVVDLMKTAAKVSRHHGLNPPPNYDEEYRQFTERFEELLERGEI